MHNYTLRINISIYLNAFNFHLKSHTNIVKHHRLFHLNSGRIDHVMRIVTHQPGTNLHEMCDEFQTKD